MAGEGGVRKRRRPRRWLRVLGWMGLLLLVAAFLVWHQRDLPRRTVERGLAERLGARVSLGSLQIRGARSFVLHDLRVRDVESAPWLDSLRARRVEAEGGVGEILDGRIARLRLSGVEATVVPPAREAAEAPPSGGLLVGRLAVADLRVRVEAGEGAEFSIEAELRDLGAGAEGSVRVFSPGFSVAPLLALRGGGALYPPLRVEGFEADLSLGAAGRELTLDARSAATRVTRGPHVLDLPGIALQASAVRSEASGAIRIEAHPVLPAVEQATLWVEIDEATNALLGGEAELSGIALAEVAALVPGLPEDLDVEGLAGLQMSVLPDGRVGYEVHGAVASLEVEEGGLRAALREFEVLLEGSIEPGEPYRGSAVARLSAGRARIAVGNADLVADGGLRVTGTGTTEGGSSPLRIDAELRLPALSGRLGGQRLPAAAAPLDLAIHGAAYELPAPRFEGELEARGAALGELRAGGTIAREGGGTTAALDWTWSGASIERLGELLLEWGAAGDDRLSVRGRLEGRGRLGGELAAPRVEGQIRAEDLRLALGGNPGGELRDGRASAGFTWDPDEPELALRSAELEGLLSLGSVDPARLRVQAEASYSPRRGLARVREATLALDDLLLLRLDGTWQEGSSPAVTARITADEVDLGRWRPRLNALAGDPLPGYTLTGTLRPVLRLGWEPGGAWRGDGEIHVGSPGLSSEDGSRVLQVADSTWVVAVESGGPGAGLTLDASAPLDGFLVLWGTVFGDWSDRPGKLDLHAEQPSDAGSGATLHRWDARAQLVLDQGPRVVVDLAATREDSVEYGVHTEVRDLASFFERWVRAPLEGSLPAVEGMQAGGAAAVELRGSLSPRARTVEGRLGLSDASLQTAGGGLAVRGLFLELPLALRWDADAAGAYHQANTAPAEGRLAFEGLRFGDVVFQETSSGLVVEADSVALQRELNMPFLGGELELERPTLVDALRPTRLLETGVRLSAVRLDDLTRALDIVPLAGTVEGHFPRVRLSGNALRVEGDGEFALLGGRLVVRDISGEEVLSRFPKIVFSAEFSGIDLNQLTHTFDFGEMNGILDGWVRDCELFRWVPVRFRARLETVERKGVPQSLNVKAINNIAILGTGGRVNVFDRGIHKFLDRYTYSKLGVEMALAQDSFVLRGLERRGERELFLKGRLPFRIDVVNAQPGQAVSFRTMLDRLATLDFSIGAAPP